MKNRISNICLCAILILNAGLAVSAQADTLVRGPYLQNGSSDSITLRWRSDVYSESKVLFGTSSSNLNKTASTSGIHNDHSVTLSGLASNTRYYYKVQTGNTFSGDHNNSFKTAPDTGSKQPVRIWAIGDSGSANSKAISVRNAYKNLTGSLHTDVWLMLGDNAYNNGTDTQYQSAVFDIYPDFLKQTLLWSTLGNHDGHRADSATQTGPYYEIFDLPANAEAGGVPSGTEAYYSFNYANIHFICLDSYDSSRTTNGAMHQWLESDLSANTQQWTIAFWHHPPYSKGSHDSDKDTELVDMRENFNPLLEQYGVDLVLSGHSHSYERSYLINGHYGHSRTFDSSHLVDGGNGQSGGDGSYNKSTADNRGAVYIVAGASGKTSTMKGRHPVMIASKATLGSVVVDVEGAELKAQFVTSTGQIFDQFTINKDSDIQPPNNTQVSFGASADVNVGNTGSHNNANSVNADGNDAGEELRGLFRWTPVDLPDGIEVVQASISFDVSNRSPGNYDLYSARNSWTEENADWNVADDSGDLVGTLAPANTGKHQVILNNNGRQLVQNWLDGGSNNGLILISSGTADGVDIRSRESGNAAVLNITYKQYSSSTPLRPRDLSAVSVDVSSIDLSWTDVADNENKYIIQRSLDALTWTTAAILKANVTGYTDKNLNGATRYYYQLKAVNSAGSSAYSALVQATTDAVSDVSPAKPANLKAVAMSDTRIDISWRDNADNETGFELQRAKSSGVWSTVAMPHADAVRYSDTKLSASTRYQYRIAAVNSTGVSAYSNSVSAVTEAASSTPLPLSITFRDGENGYSGTQDGSISSLKKTKSYNSQNVVTDGWQKKKGIQYSLIQWDLSQIPVDAVINKADIKLSVTNSSKGEYQLYAMTSAWREGSSLTWDKVSGDSHRSHVLSGSVTPTAKGWYTLNLNHNGIQQVQSWVNNPEDNHGFMIVDNNSDDSFAFRSSNNKNISQRPAISVSYTKAAGVEPVKPQTVTISFQNGVNGYSGTQDSYIASNRASDNFADKQEILADGSSSMGEIQGLIQWDLKDIPVGAMVESASIELDIFNVSSGKYAFYAVRQDWNEANVSWTHVNGKQAHDTVSIGALIPSSSGKHRISLNAEGLVLLQSWLNGSRVNNGLLIKSEGTKNGMDVRSSDYGIAASRPKLSITYRQ